MKMYGRIISCGQISSYNTNNIYGILKFKNNI